MRALIRRITDNVALAEENERLRAENDELRRQIDSRMFRGPSFQQVAKDFDPSKIEGAVLDHMCRQLEPALREDVFPVILEVATAIRNHRPWIYASVADQIESPVRNYKLRIKEFNTTIQGAIY